MLAIVALNGEVNREVNRAGLCGAMAMKTTERLGGKTSKRLGEAEEERAERRQKITPVTAKRDGKEMRT